MRIFSLQAKEAGADDILDISKCELSEVCSPHLPVSAHRSEFFVCFLLLTVRFSIMSMSLETEMALLLVHFFLYLLSSGFQVRASSPFFIVGDCLFYLMLQQRFCPRNPFSFDKVGRAEYPPPVPW